jgi:endonuclease III
VGARRSLLKRIDRILERTHRSPRHGNFRDPTTELFYVLLTVRTRISDVADHLRELRRFCRTWDELPDLRGNEMLPIFRPLGFGRKRCAVLWQVAAQIRADFGHVSIARLRSWSSDESIGYLRTLPYVGEKVARCVALYSLDADVSPMDSHATRILSRVGVLPRGIAPAAAHVWMDTLTPTGAAYRLHVNLVAHGQQICTARSPDCRSCAIRNHCRFARTGR